jgi:hypothetical protein
VCHLRDLEQRVIVLQRVVPVVIAERSLGLPLARGNVSDQREFRERDERMRAAAMDLRDAVAGDEGCEEHLGHVLGQRRNRGQDERRRTAKEDRRRQGLAARFRDVVVVAAPLPDLPVHAGGAAVVHLHAVHPEVVASSIRVRRVDQGERHERTSILGPAGQCRQAIEPDIRGQLLDDRSGRHLARTDLDQIAGDVARVPQGGRARRQQRVGQLHEAADEAQRALAERALRAARRAKQVGDEAEIGSRDIREEQRRPAGRDHPPVDLRGFEVRIDAGLHRNEVIVTAELVDKRSEVWKRQFPDS